MQVRLEYFCRPQPDGIHCHSDFSLPLILEIPFASIGGTKAISRAKDSHKGHLYLNGFILWEEAVRNQVKEVAFPFRNRRDIGNLDQLSRRKTDPRRIRR